MFKTRFENRKKINKKGAQKYPYLFVIVNHKV